MITLLENAEHQVTLLGTGLIDDARQRRVDCTGFKVLDAPQVEINADGSLTLRFVVPVDSAPRKKSKRENLNNDEPDGSADATD